jgi:hypothetical protein
MAFEEAVKVLRTNSKKLRLALVGCGRIAQVHWLWASLSLSAAIHPNALNDSYDRMYL